MKIRPLSLEHAAKLRAAAMRPKTQETKAKFRAARLGHPLSEETKRKQSAALLGRSCPWNRRKVPLPTAWPDGEIIEYRTKGRPRPSKFASFWHRVDKGNLFRIKLSEAKKGKAAWNKGRTQEAWNKGVSNETTRRCALIAACSVRKVSKFDKFVYQLLDSTKIPYSQQQLIEDLTIADAVIAPKTAVFNDGCWIHGHERCVDGSTKFSGEYKKWGGESISETRNKDATINRILLQKGWRVIRFWECEIRKDPSIVSSTLDPGWQETLPMLVLQT